MKRKIIVAPTARVDIKDHFHYINERNQKAAKKFLKASRETFQRLSAMPGIGVSRNYSNSELEGLRFVTITGFQNYLVFYLTSSESIQIIRVLHGAQNIELILSES